MGSLLNDNDYITIQRIYLGRDQEGSCGPDGSLVAALLSPPPPLDSRGVMWAQGRGRQLQWTPLFASLPAHLYADGGENAKESGGVTLQAETQSHKQTRTRVCHRGRWYREDRRYPPVCVTGAFESGDFLCVSW